MYDGHNVDVPAEYAEDVLNAMSHARIKGKHIHVEKANSNDKNLKSEVKTPETYQSVSLTHAGVINLVKKSRSRSKD